MRVITTIQEMVAERSSCASSQKSWICSYHGISSRGHLSLVRKARKENEILTTSIFVNRHNLAHEDLASYPRDLPHDLNMLENLGVDIVFVQPLMRFTLLVS